MKLVTALLENLFGAEQAGGHTMSVTVVMTSSALCSRISRCSTCGGDETSISFKPPLPLEEALLHAAKYKEKGGFTHS